jgi:hypothetical protein
MEKNYNNYKKLDKCFLEKKKQYPYNQIYEIKKLYNEIKLVYVPSLNLMREESKVEGGNEDKFEILVFTD